MSRATEMHICDLLRKDAKLFPNKEAIVFQEVRLTYKSLYERTNRIANALIRLGIRKGDRVAVLMQNCHQYAELYFAIPKCGAIIVPLNYRLSVDELAWILKNAEPDIVIAGEPFYDVWRSLGSKAAQINQIIGVGRVDRGMINYDEMLQESSMEPQPNVHDDDVVVIYYTSGTTGKPKGAMLTHRNLIANSYTNCLAYRERFGDSYIIISPMFHAVSPAHLFARTFIGNTCIILGKWDVELYLETVQREKVTHIFLVPAMVIFLLDYPYVNNYDLSSLRLLHYGGAPLDVDRIKQAKEVFGCDMIQGFGMTEVGTSAVTLLNQEDHTLDSLEKERRLASVGRDTFDAEVAVLDDNGHEVPPEQVGEICVRGQHVMKGYWRNPEETKKALRNGWFHTGDLGKTDSGGYVYVVDRKHDMIISGAENIYSAEVESQIISHPAVAEVAVIGVPDPKWGEAVKAVVVIREGKKVTEEEIIQYCKKHLASYKKPKSVDFIDALPKNAMGKILKKDLKAAYWKGYKKGVH